MMRRIFVPVAALSLACTSDFNPRQATFTCEGDEQCASGWRCVDPGGGPICAQPVGFDGSVDALQGEVGDGVDGGELRGETVTEEVEVLGESETDAALDPRVVPDGITFTVEGDELVQVGGTGKHYFVASEMMTLSEAEAACAARSAGGLTWSLSRINELRALSRCCRTQPGTAERCVNADASCVFAGPCTAVPECKGCGAPPAGDACWWDPTFAAECGLYWAQPAGSCNLAFDFDISEIVTPADGITARVICTANAL